jgi:hypothetical protein
MLEKQVPTILSLSRLYSLVAETVGKGSGIKRRKLKTLWRDGAIDRTTEQLLGNIRELDFFKEESKNQTCWPCAGCYFRLQTLVCFNSHKKTISQREMSGKGKHWGKEKSLVYILETKNIDRLREELGKKKRPSTLTTGPASCF